MQSMRELVGQEMTWAPRHMRMAPEYELSEGGQIAATMHFRSEFGSLATAECDDGVWTFKRVGFFRTRVNARARGTEADLAVFTNNTWSNGGTIEKVGGGSFQASTNFWSSRFDIANAAGDSLVRFESRFGIVIPKRLVVIQPAAADLDELPWLVLFGWYLLVMLQSDGGGAAAAAAAAGAC